MLGASFKRVFSRVFWLTLHPISCSVSEIEDELAAVHIRHMQLGVGDLVDAFAPGMHIKRRLTHPRFLDMYKKISKASSTLHLKTDNSRFMDYTLEVLEETPHEDKVVSRDLYKSPLNEEHFGIQTKYEKIWTEKGSKIHYLRFKMI